MSSEIKKYRGFLTGFNEEKFKEKYYDDYVSVIEYAKDKDFCNEKFELKLYNYINGITEIPVTDCGNKKQFVSLSKGYNMFCKKHCECMKKYNKFKREQTCLEKYGVNNYAKTSECKDKVIHTNLEKYGVEYYLQTDDKKEKTEHTNIEKYGCRHSSQNKEVILKMKKTKKEKYGDETYVNHEKYVETCIRKYGVENISQLESIKEKKKKTSIEHFGCEHPFMSESVKSKSKNTILEKYGVEYNCMRQEARMHSNNSKPNREFAQLLEENNICYEREFNLKNYSYDFKIGNVLIEINPTITHNSFLNIFGDKPIDPSYHLDKSKCAKENDCHCMHIFDWDDKDKIINILKPKETLYARKLVLKEVSEKECNEFLNLYHLQNTCKGQKIRYGLYKDNTLVQVMTFGKPRYNKNYELELLRLCSHKDYKIVGGVEKIFKYILDKFKPESIISYCDYSKFDGGVYKRLGFSLKSKLNPSKHWYNPKSNQHITDNLLRQRGFDQIFNTNYGKGTSNEELMIQYGFLPVYDCGQMTFILNIN